MEAAVKALVADEEPTIGHAQGEAVMGGRCSDGYDKGSTQSQKLEPKPKKEAGLYSHVWES